MILKAGLVDPTENQFEIIRRYPPIWKHQEINPLRTKTYINPFILIVVLLKTHFHNRFLDLISESNVNDSLATTNRFNINIGKVRLVGKRP